MVSFQVTSSLLALLLLKDVDAFTPRNLAMERSRGVSTALLMVRQLVMADGFQVEQKGNLSASIESVEKDVSE